MHIGRLGLVALVLAALALGGGGAPTQVLAADCQFILGFKAVHDAMPDVVGDCKTNEYHNPQNGDGLQDTTGVDGKGGLLVWRKADNWTAYTDGYRTWIMGPNGLQMRLNTERFEWEKDPIAPAASAPKWKVHDDAEKSFKYPDGWIAESLGGGVINRYISPKGDAAVFYKAAFKMGPSFKVEDFLISAVKALASNQTLVMGAIEPITVSAGFPGVVLPYEIKGKQKGFAAAIQNGANVYYLEYTSMTPVWPTYEPLLKESLNSFVPKSAN